MKCKKILAVACSVLIGLSTAPISQVSAATVAQSSSQALLKKSNVKRRSTKALTGRNLKLYNILKKDVAAVTAGKRSSTIFKISLKSIGLNKAATKKQLGIKSFVNKNGYVTQSTDQALQKYLNIDFASVINYMYGTEPFNLYWFDYYDENARLDTSSNYNLQFLIKKNKTIQYYTKSGYIRLKFAVAKDYGSTYKVSAAAYKRAANVTANAKAIVAANANVSDYNKLMNYAKVICDAVTYDEAAATRTRKNYTDPWQCLAVFDGDTSTNVVCEGYSKAFSYLCSLTKFNSPLIKANLMTGANWVVGSSERNLHMWNLVTMPDGKNYIVDLTNSDLDGSNDDMLVLVGTTSTDSSGDMFHQINNYSLGTTNSHPTVGYQYDSISKQIFKTSELKVATSDYPAEERVSTDMHIYNIGKVTTAATLTHTGVLTKTCQFDGETVNVTIPKLKVGTPKISKLTYKKGTATINWSKASNAKSYQLSYKLSGQSWKYVTVRSTSKTIKNLKRKKTYSLRVRAKNGSYTSSWSAVKNLKTT